MSTLLRQRIELVCLRCGKTRSLKYSRTGKTGMCQPCAITVADKRRRGAARFRLDDETIDDRLAELKND
jgi:hypothetical protein